MRTPRGILVMAALAMVSPAWGQAAPESPASRPAGTSPWVEKTFVNPPLKCFRPYTRIDEFPMITWCFHGARPAGRFGYNEEFVRDAKACGFNVLIDVPSMLDPCAKAGVKLITPQFHFEPERLYDSLFRSCGDHPALLGVVLDDNCPRIYPSVIASARWMTQAYPHVVPWIADNPNPRDQSRTPLRILGTQNYVFLRGGAGPKAVADYCNSLNYDRLFVNARDMSAWVLFGGHNAPSEIRFQETAALAYGVQGLVLFAYTPHRTKLYTPGNPAIADLARLHRYVVNVLGRHLWGTRCIDVLHSADGGAHTKAPAFDASRPVVKASASLLVGLLTPEQKFLAAEPDKPAAPEYFLLVDKRTGAATPPARDIFVMLGASFPAVELLDEQAVAAAPVRRIVPGWKVRARTEGGQALLLRAGPPLERLLGGKQGLAIYTGVADAMGALQQQVDRPLGAPALPQLTRPEIDQALSAARTGVARLQNVLADDVKAGAISAAQADDTIAALRAGIDATGAEAIESLKTAPATRPLP